MAIVDRFRITVSVIISLIVIFICGRAVASISGDLLQSKEELGAVWGLIFGSLPFVYKFVNGSLERIGLENRLASKFARGPSKIVSVLSGAAAMIAIANIAGFIIGFIVSVTKIVISGSENIDAVDLTKESLPVVYSLIFLFQFVLSGAIGFWVAKRHDKPRAGIIWSIYLLGWIINSAINAFVITHNDTARAVVMGGQDPTNPAFQIGFIIGLLITGIVVVPLMVLSGFLGARLVRTKPA
jgi:tetrahydromethanopterin S-methyltransferase subunit F